LVYEEKITTIGIRLNGELSYTDPNYGFELGYAVGTVSTQTQTISLGMGESVQFKNVDTKPHSAAFLGNATLNNAPWPGAFNGSTTQSPAGTAIGTTGWATGSLNPNHQSPIYETGLPGFYMIGCQYHYNTSEMRTVIIVH
jgi:plastocyanin